MSFELPQSAPLPLEKGRVRRASQKQLLWFAAAVIVVSGGLLAWALQTLHDQALHTGEQLSESFAHVIEEQTSRTFQSLDQRLQLVDKDLHELAEYGPIAKDQAQSLLRHHLQEQPDIRAFWITDAKGRVQYTTQMELLGQSMAGSDSFQIYQQAEDTVFSLSNPVYNRTTSSWLIHASRPLRAPGGQFLGVVVASLDIAYFEKIWSKLEVGRQGSIALLRQDGTLMARSPVVASALGKNFSRPPAFSNRDSGKGAGTMHYVSPIDNTDRVMAYRTLSSPTGFVVVVGQSTERVLHAWGQFASVAAGVWVLAAAAIVLLCFLLGRAGRKRMRSEEGQLEVFERITDAFVALDTQWRIMYINQRAEQMLSRPTGSLIGKNLWEEFPLDVRDNIRMICESAMASRQPAQMEEYYPPLQRWFETRVYPAPQGLTLYFQDVSVRKQAEQALRASELRYRLLFESSPQPMWVVGKEDLRFLAVNDIAITHYGYSREDFLHMTLLDVHPPEDAQELQTYAARQRAGMNRHGLWRHQRKYGSLMLVEVTSHSLEWDGQTGQLTLINDVTEREKAQEALHVSDLALKAVSQGVLITGVDHRILTANEAFLSITGYSAEEVIGNTCNFLWGPLTDPASLATLEQCIQEEREYSGELIHYKKNGETFWNDLSVAPVRSLHGEPSHFIGITRDITERKRAELAMAEHKRQLQELSRRVLEAQEVERRRVARELHDELGQSLTAIKINLQSFERFPNQSPADLHAENIRIVDDVLQQVRSLALALRPSVLDDLGLVPALRWVTEQTAGRAGLAVVFETTVEPVRFAPEIETACFRIAQEALTNVIRHAQATQVIVSLRHHGDALVLAVSDDGRGFNFAAMRASAQAGASLGVLGMEERATLVGGQLEIDSSPGHGSTVCLRCPWLLLQTKENP